jgi:hypothetical protein
MRSKEVNMNERPEIHVSTFPHNMQTWYEEKLTLALLALNRLQEDINLPSDDISKKERIEYDLDTARIYVQTVLDMSVGV